MSWRTGGSELSPVIDVATVGRLQMMKDPQGAAFALHSRPAQ
jgi:predicted enzyme related to lactoylglutathione lyase